uniref:Uncharacterized protein n=1 Tax=Physcomitrium patens TaxID=3218 RepID=A0A2K1J6K5_PHYPA|nr:hypothetical protein PHYPA_020259 [Physcomitrium patens]
MDVPQERHALLPSRKLRSHTTRKTQLRLTLRFPNLAVTDSMIPGHGSIFTATEI